jgi:hypothetical protein
MFLSFWASKYQASRSVSTLTMSAVDVLAMSRHGSHKCQTVRAGSEDAGNGPAALPSTTGSQIVECSGPMVIRQRVICTPPARSR